MKNRLLLIIISISLLVGGSLFGYFYYQKVLKVDTWDLVPNNALMVYESNNTIKVWNGMQKKGPWRNLLSVPFYKDWKQHFESLDSIGGETGQLDRLLRGNQLLVSLHITSDDSFDFMYYLELKDLKATNIAANIIGAFEKDPNHIATDRKYKNFEIRALKNASNGSIFTFVNYKNFFIGSFTPHLVEDAIRNITGENLKTFKNQYTALFDFSKLENDEGNLYLNSAKFEDLYGIFADGKSFPALRFFSEEAFLDINMTENALLMNGFSATGKENHTTYLSTFKGQQPQKIGLQNYLPNRTAMLFHLSLSDASKWQENLRQYWKKRAPKELIAWDQLNKKHGFDVDKFYSWIGEEIGLGVLESVDPERPERILIVHGKDVNEGLNQLNKFAEKLFTSSEDTLYVENYSGHEIRQIPLEEFPSMLFGQKFKGFDQCFFTVLDSYVVFANTVQVVKNLITDQELENVWSKSIKQGAFMDTILEEANVNLIVNTLSLWNIFHTNLSPKWKNFAEDFQAQLKRYEHYAAQFHYVDNKFFTSIAASFDGESAVDNLPKNYVLLQNAFTEGTITSKPHTVRNHRNGSLEILVQDDNNFLYLINGDGKILWRDSIHSPIIGKISQIDYYKNNKLQYFFITQDALHLIDRLGNYVEGFPLVMPSPIKLEQAAVLDYDRSKRYRFLVADKLGHIYMFDKLGTNLAGWRPRKLNDRLSTAPFHVRVRGRDCIVAVQENGIVNMMNRRGEMYPGFPFDLKDKINNPIFVDIGADFSSSSLTTVTNSGQLVELNFKGAVVARKQLYRPTKEATFTMAIDALGRTFIIARQEENRVSILDRKGEVIFEKDYVASSKMEIQYYNFSQGQQVYVLIDPDQEFTYIYDAKGRLINYQPIESGYKIGLMYFDAKNKFRVFKNFGNNFSILEYNR